MKERMLFALHYNNNNYNKNKHILKKEEEDELGEDGTGTAGTTYIS